jgi:hypothetical protein
MCRGSHVNVSRDGCGETPFLEDSQRRQHVPTRAGAPCTDNLYSCSVGLQQTTATTASFKLKWLVWLDLARASGSHSWASFWKIYAFDFGTRGTYIVHMYVRVADACRHQILQVG